MITLINRQADIHDPHLSQADIVIEAGDSLDSVKKSRSSVFGKSASFLA